jgi:hypothetical protein
VSDRYLVAVFTVDAGTNEAEIINRLHRVSHNYPFECFKFAKEELAANLDSEYVPPQQLQIAEFAKQQGVAVDEKPQPPIGNAQHAMKVVPLSEPRPLDLQGHNKKANEELIAKLNQMNEAAEKAGIIQSAPKANVVADVPAGSEHAGG